MLKLLTALGIVSPVGDCWFWGRATQSRGYGQTSKGLAHRVFYESLVGPIPEGMTIDHLCFNKRCVNVDHMEVVTRDENRRRAEARYREAIDRKVYANSLKTTCPQGHEYDGVNSRGQRYCKACNRAAAARHRKARARD